MLTELVKTPLKNYLRGIAILLLVVIMSYSPILVNAQGLTADKNATPETKMLYQNLFKLIDKGVMYGHQEDPAYGVGWEYQEKRSDVKSVTGSYPAVYGWDAGRIESDSTRNLDAVPFQNMVTYMQEAYKRGGINTISWHIDDPVTGKTSWSNPTNSVKLILDSVKYQNAYKAYLDKFAAFVSQLKGRDGKMIPIIFRPLHENTGNWFWWGKTSCTPREYIALWRLTFNYLVTEKKLHNLLFAYSPSDFTSVADYNERYPGNEYVDIVGFDAYCEKDPDAYGAYLDNRLQLLNSVAHEHLKLPALTEFGYNTIPVANWWTKTILPLIKTTKISYMLTWRNWKEDHFFSPYPGQISANDFKIFFDDRITLFQDDVRPSIYKKALK